MSLTLRNIAANAYAPPATYFVMRQALSPWSNAAVVVGVTRNQILAEDICAKEKARDPSQHFCVARLSCEAREVVKPVEIVRVD